MAPLLEVKDLSTAFFTRAGTIRAVDGVSFSVDPGEVVAIVGESGCGKSVTSLSILGLVRDPGRVTSGSIRLDGEELLTRSEREWQRIRGKRIGMIFQDPMASLNPVLTVGEQIGEPLRRHQGMDRKSAHRRAMKLLDMVGIPGAASRVAQYPHEFSGGMRQRVMIAMALSCEPRLLIADEPTTALDVTIQAQIMELLKRLRAELGTAVILITHDLGVVAGVADRVLVMYAGKLIESGPVRQIYRDPSHPYTRGLLRSVPRLDAPERQRLQPIDGQPPDLLEPPSGCRFAPRCPSAMAICTRLQPALAGVGGDPSHQSACWLSHPLAPKAAPANPLHKEGLPHGG